jgi:hypothetical protein
VNFDIDNHRKEFPHTAVQIVEGRLYGIWMIGNNYKRPNGYYGEYPPHYVDRVRSLFPEREHILHLFSGSIQSQDGREHTFDIQETGFHPEVIGRAEEVHKHFMPESFELVMADPPYSPSDAAAYGTKMPNIPAALRSLHDVVKTGGVVVWLSTRPPMYRKDEWNLVGVVGLHCGTNRSFRSIIFLEKI